MNDQCKNCTIRGDYERCKAAECSKHEYWISQEHTKQIHRLEYLVDKLNMELIFYNTIRESERGFSASETISLHKMQERKLQASINAELDRLTK